MLKSTLLKCLSVLVLNFLLYSQGYPSGAVSVSTPLGIEEVETLWSTRDDGSDAGRFFNWLSGGKYYELERVLGEVEKNSFQTTSDFANLALLSDLVFYSLCSKSGKELERFSLDILNVLNNHFPELGAQIEKQTREQTRQVSPTSFYQLVLMKSDCEPELLTSEELPKTNSEHEAVAAELSEWKRNYRDEEEARGYHTVPPEEFTDLESLDFAQGAFYLTDFQTARGKTTLPAAIDFQGADMDSIGYEAIGVVSETGSSALSGLYRHSNFGVVNVVQQDMSNISTEIDEEAYNAQLFQTRAIVVVERKEGFEDYYSTVIWSPPAQALEYSFSANINLADEAKSEAYFKEIESILSKAWNKER